MRALTLILMLVALCVPQAQAICVLCSCEVSAAPLTFGAFEPLDSAPLDGAGAIEVSCSGIAALSAIDVGIGGGINGTVAQRKLKSGANLLNYNLYTNAGRTQIWGDGTGGYPDRTINNTLSLLTWNSSTPVYGRIAAAPAAPVGAYSDTVTISVEW
ncbi:sigma-fimbriae tip adhesin [alpha proteobacterium U9-1i]|nr:sigma-fimbriae tip adhesin [alpha proteobacterium U9-1i]